MTWAKSDGSSACHLHPDGQRYALPLMPMTLAAFRVALSAVL